jgi:hypothetical protein
MPVSPSDTGRNLPPTSASFEAEVNGIRRLNSMLTIGKMKIFDSTSYGSSAIVIGFRVTEASQ